MSSKRERFVETSLELIHQKGFRATTIRDIAERMDCDVSNVYNYIDSKQGLLESHLFQINSRFHERVDELIDSSYGPTEKIKRLVGIYVHMTFTWPLECSLLVNEWRNLKEPKLSEFVEEKTRFEKKVEKIIEEGICEGTFRKMNTEIATFGLLSSVRWLFSHYVGRVEELNKTEIEKEISEFVINGILKKEV